MPEISAGQGLTIKERLGGGLGKLRDGMGRMFKRSASSQGQVATDVPQEEPALRSRTVEDVIDDIDPKVPAIFREQARVAAGFIDRLDRGEAGVGTDPRIAKFVDQISPLRIC